MTRKNKRKHVAAKFARFSVSLKVSEFIKLNARIKRTGINRSMTVRRALGFGR